MVYSAYSATPQDENSYPLNPLDDIPETRGLLDEDPRHILWGVLTSWERGDVSANEAMFWLSLSGNISPHWIVPRPNDFLKAFLERERAKAEGRAEK